MAARTKREPLAEEPDGHVVAGSAAIGAERHLMRPIPIDHAFAEFTVAIDQAGLPADRVAARAHRYLPGEGCVRGSLQAASEGCIRERTKREHYPADGVQTMDGEPKTIEELRELERDVEREWWWLHGALTAVAQVRAERWQGDPLRFREMQAQAQEVDRRRVEIAVRIAELQGEAWSGG